MTPHTAALLQAVFVVFLWGTSWVFIKIGLQDIPPILFAGMRYGIAFLCLAIMLGFSKARIELRTLSKREWGRLILLGILYYTATQGAIFLALAHLPAVTVNLLWSFSTVIVALLGVAWLSENPTVMQWIGIALAVSGAVIYFHPASIPLDQTIGVVIALLGVLANAISSILGRQVNRSERHNPLVVTVVSMGAGSALLLITGFTFEEMPALDLKSWGILFWLALVNTAFAFTLWNHTLRTLTAMESSIINGTMLIWIPILAILFLGETITGREGIGLVVTGLGTVIVQLRKRPG
jgi:O-acetylserine/cysteine efflux transporter